MGSRTPWSQLPAPTDIGGTLSKKQEDRARPLTARASCGQLPGSSTYIAGLLADSQRALTLTQANNAKETPAVCDKRGSGEYVLQH